MSDLDQAHLTLIVSTRPGPGHDPGTSKPIPGAIVRLHTGRADVDDHVVRVLLGQGFELVRGHLSCTAIGQVDITSAGQTLYSGPAPQPGRMPPAWVELAEALSAAILYIAVTDRPLDTEDQINQAARDGHLVAGYATLDLSPAWATAHRRAIPGAAE